MENTPKTFTGTLYTKTMRGVSPKTGKETKFSKTLIKTDKGTFDCVLCTSAKKKLEKVSYPQAVEFTAKQHFVKSEDYTNKDGEVKSKFVVFLIDVTTFYDTEFESKTLDTIGE